MESWSYVSGGKGYMPNDVMSTSDSFARRKMPWWAGDSKPPSFGNGILVPGQVPVDNQGLGLFGYQDFVGKQLHESSMNDVMSSRAHGAKIISPFTGLENESSSRLSSSIVDSNSKEQPSLFDLQLGVFGDPRDSQNSRVSGGAPVASSSESYMPPKRTRMGVTSHTTYCQVHGCNKDLSSSKEYHKRHKVCEIHSKTAKVIVNGIEQRFCQQCSRFHLLAEFDDGKRSCRKRLAGHNQRRRKPQVGFHSGRTSRLLQAYHSGPCPGFDNGRFHGTAITPTSFVCPDILPSSLIHPDDYKPNDWSRRVKVEQGANYNPISAVSISNGNLPSRLLFPSNSGTGGIFAENSSHYLHNLGAPDANSRSLVEDSSLGNDDFPAFEATSTIQGLSGITDSGCALSLLSSQSNRSSSHSSGIHIARPMVVPGRNSHYSMAHVSEKLMAVSSLTSSGGLPSRFASQVTTSAEGSHFGPMLIPESNEAISFDLADGVYQGHRFINEKNHLCCEAGGTINLLQLSSQLQRVECEKQSMQVKQEGNAFCCPNIT